MTAGAPWTAHARVPTRQPDSAVGAGAGRLSASRPGGQSWIQSWLCGLLVLLAVMLATSPALALKAIPVNPDQERIEITTLGEFYESRGDNLQIETAAGIDGLAGRMAVRAATPGTNPNWVVFALTNTSDKPLERWLTAERYTVIGSGVVWPDLDARRMEAITPSIGFIPERIKSDRADIFRLSLDPGQTITYVVELSSERLARIFLWKPIDYELKARDRQLFNGIMLGLLGLLAIFLTAIFAANHKLIFPTAALVAWCVLGYLCVDFGFFHKLFQLRPEGNAVYRAATEAAMAASLVIFLHTYLRLGAWHGFIRMLVGAWILAQLALVAVAVIDPRLASTFARLSFVLIGGAGMLFTLFLALRGQDRALALVPTWLLFLVWIFAASVVLTGRLSGDIVVSGLAAGLVLIIVLLGFTVTQFAFRALEPIHGVAPSELQLRSLAVDGSHAALWQWNARRDELKISPHVETSLGLAPGALSTSVDDFLRHMHHADRERFRLTLWSVQERNGGDIHVEFRLRHADNSFRWFEVEAASGTGTERRSLRCIGLMRDITDARRAQERLLHDAVHDSLTGLPNRELFLDRLTVAVTRAQSEPDAHPTVMFIDLDRFRTVNTERGLVVGDSLLLTIARRLQRHLGAQDTIARVGGDQFAILLLGQTDARELAQLAERVRRSLRSPINITGEEVVLTGAVGLAVFDGDAPSSASDLLKDAETAMHRAKRQGADRIEIFRPDMRTDRQQAQDIETDLLKALERNQVQLLYRPIAYLPTGELAGFEAMARWEHPQLGAVDPTTLIGDDDANGVALRLGSFVLTNAAQAVARWQKELPRAERPLFIDVAVSSSRVFRQDLIQEIRHILGRAVAPMGALKLSIAESLVLENPEQASEILEWLRGAGAELVLSEFGSGYSSLSYLQRFPFDSIRIDPVLVQMSAPDGQGSPLVRAIAALAHELGRKVIADGVETPDDTAFVRSIGCEFAQGPGVGEPRNERRVLEELKDLRKSQRKLQSGPLFRRTSTKSGTRTGSDQPAVQEPASLATGGALDANGAGKGQRSQRPRKPRLAPGMTVRTRRHGPQSGHDHLAAEAAAAASRPTAAHVMPPPMSVAAAMPPDAYGANGHFDGMPEPSDFGPVSAAAMAAATAAHPAAGPPPGWAGPDPMAIDYPATFDHTDSPHQLATGHDGEPDGQQPLQPHHDAPDAAPPSLSSALARATTPNHGPAADPMASAEPDGAGEAPMAPFSAVLPAAEAHDAEPPTAPPHTADRHPAEPNGAAHQADDEPTSHAAARERPRVTEMPELKTLPPAIAASLARLAGVPIGGHRPPPGAAAQRKPPLAGE